MVVITFLIGEIITVGISFGFPSNNLQVRALTFILGTAITVFQCFILRQYTKEVKDNNDKEK